MKLVWLITLLACAVIVLPASADSGEEDRLIAVLQSSASQAEKEDACRKLKQIGSPKSVPVLAGLLHDEHLIQAVCDALETMPFEEADAALQAALKSAIGKNQASIIHALGERRNPDSVKPLAALLDDADPLVASYAAGALGTIGGKEASRALLRSLKNVKEPVRSVMVDALLQCATQFHVAGDHAAASSLFKRFTGKTERGQVRVAAYAGLLRTAGNRVLPEILSSIKGSDPAKQTAALLVAREVQGPKATQSFTNLLTQTPPTMQIALLGLLQQRGDASAGPAALAAARSAERDVRVAAITALGTLGDASAISVLANGAASSDESEQKAAREALIELRLGRISEAMVARLTTARPEAQAELIRALTARNEKSAVPKLIELAMAGTGQASDAALSGLDRLADSTNLPALVQLLVTATNDVTLVRIRRVFESLADRVVGGQKLEATPVATAFVQADRRGRIALLSVCGFFPDPRIRVLLRAALKDSDVTIQNAAARAICETRDVEMLLDLIDLAHNSKELGAPAFDSYVRFVEDEANGVVGLRRVQLLRPAYDLAKTKELKWSVLAALSGAAHPEALDLANRARADEATRAEAEAASARIAESLLAIEPNAATAALRELATNANSWTIRGFAEGVLKRFDSGWVYAGPYRLSGKQCHELFDIEFPAERRGTNRIEWRRAAGTVVLARLGEVDLAQVVGGDHCVIYLRTRVFVPKAEAVTLEIGSDDGIKLWVNGELVHANNAVRGLAPAQDYAKANLHEGWNDLLAKITQSTAGCGMMLRIVGQDGAEIQGVKFDSNGAQ